jgi:hypothetical protein
MKLVERMPFECARQLEPRLHFEIWNFNQIWQHDGHLKMSCGGPWPSLALASKVSASYILDKIDCCSVTVIEKWTRRHRGASEKNVKTIDFSGLLRPRGHRCAALRASVIVGTPELQSKQRPPF